MTETPLCESCDAYVALAEEKIRGFEERGILVVKTLVDVEAMAAWCRQNGNRINARGRAAYGCRKSDSLSPHAPYSSCGSCGSCGSCRRPTSIAPDQGYAPGPIRFRDSSHAKPIKVRLQAASAAAKAMGGNGARNGSSSAAAISFVATVYIPKGKTAPQ